MTIPERNPEIERFGEVIFEEKVPSVLVKKNDTLDPIMTTLFDHKLIDEELKMGTRLALDEAFTNAIRHGNQNIPEKMVKILIFSESKRWSIVFEDEGEGFAPKELPDFEQSEFLFAEGGRGLFLMHYYMDDVIYIGTGNIIQLIKNL
ncbi:MAG: hypothetical protein COA79_16935 [Planctomycetota bacterium]|nr:MAG: hypothetical protein COA79_16935 [Planctomycetota bacterium]